MKTSKSSKLGILLIIPAGGAGRTWDFFVPLIKILNQVFNCLKIQCIIAPEDSMLKIEQFKKEYVKDAIAIWNDIVMDGIAFPQKETLDEKSGTEFFNSQSFTGIAIDTDSNEVVGLYILHPNNVGRCGHISNASYAVKKSKRGMHIGEFLVKDCLTKAKEIGFKILQFNAVVASNTSALKLYAKLGFTQLGIIPNGFLMKDGTYEDIIPHYIEL